MTRPGEELRREGVLPDINGLYADSTRDVSALVPFSSRRCGLSTMAKRLRSRQWSPATI